VPRRRRRRTFRKTEGPDRAWLLTDFLVEIPVTTISPALQLDDQAALLFSFDDITDTEDNLSREKSDWFVQRMLIDWIPNMDALQQADLRYSKLYQHNLLTMNNRLAESTDTGGTQSVLTDNIYNRAARILHTGLNPVHAHWNPVVSIAQDGELQTSGGDPGAAQVGLSVAPWLGTEHVSLDLSSKFGLREDTNCYLAFGPWEKADIWPEDNTLTILGLARTLVQRKRMR